MTLLNKIQSAINAVDGNHLTIEDTRGYDEYWCDIGKHRVFEDAYNHKHKCCFKCWYDETDHTRYADGDEPEVSNDNQ